MTIFNGKTFRKILSAVLVLSMTLSGMFLLSCAKYNADWIIGKTSSEIEDRYGTFDYIMSKSEKNSEGNYCTTTCAYLVKEERVGFLGTDPAEYYAIYFDEEGKAKRIYEKWYVPGG